jgi:hypothetical protein
MAKFESNWAVVQNMRGLSREVRAKAYGYGALDAIVGSSTLKEQLGFLKQIDSKIDELDVNGRLGKMLVSGELDEDRWSNIASVQGNALNDIANSFGVGFVDFWNGVVVKSTVEAAQEVSDTASELKASSPWILGAVVVIVIGLVVLKVA